MRTFAQLKKIRSDVYEVDHVFDMPSSFDPRLNSTRQRIVEAPKNIKKSEIKKMIFKGGRWAERNEDMLAQVIFGKGPKFIDYRITPGEVFWTGLFYECCGYGKMNRELVFRVANTLKVQVVEHKRPPFRESYDDTRLNYLSKIRVSGDAPMVRGLTPSPETHNGYRVCMSMIETERAHPLMVNTFNNEYQEIWTPTHWNKQMFEESGVKIPIKVINLGVNQFIYRPRKPLKRYPTAELLSTKDAGKLESPQGFRFFWLGQPVFRKNIQMLVECFDKAFAGNQDVCLILCTTTAPKDPPAYLDSIAKIVKSSHRSRIYALSNRAFTDEELANIYSSSHAYVCTSLGEGWNLPLCEAAACGIPVVAPKNTSHLDYLDNSNSYLFDPDGTVSVDTAGLISPYYTGQKFHCFSEKSEEQLIWLMKEIYHNYEGAKEKAKRLCRMVRKYYTWDHAADQVIQRLLELN
jgi:glycosyltransferase involved in cell wall biosynthesis